MIRKPINADYEVKKAFDDVEDELSDLDSLRQQITQLTARIAELEKEKEAVLPGYHVIDGDLIVKGSLRVESSLDVRGDVSAPGQLDGVAGAVAPSVGANTGATTRVIQVNGSLTVLGAIQCHTLKCHDLRYTGTLTTP